MIIVAGPASISGSKLSTASLYSPLDNAKYKNFKIYDDHQIIRRTVSQYAPIAPCLAVANLQRFGLYTSKHDKSERGQSVTAYEL
jgi:hypothetical protein